MISKLGYEKYKLQLCVKEIYNKTEIRFTE